ncbi:MAG: PilZ domain-containing protein [Thioalkalivibrionaceae bacterium]
MEDRRRFPRLPMTVEVSVRNVDGHVHRFTCADLSGGGAFLNFNADDRPEELAPFVDLSAEDELVLQVLGFLGDGASAPEVRARVVRVTEDGIAVRFDDDH